MEAKRLEELPNKMALLNIIEAGSSNTDNTSLPESNTRVLRQRKKTAPEISKSSNRRFNVKPRRHSVMENANLKQIEAFYLSKKIKTSQTLETIYEEPKSNNTYPNRIFGGRKLKRMVTFQIGECTKEKLKKRRARIIKLMGSRFLNRKKVPMDMVMKTVEWLQQQLEETQPTIDANAVE